MDFGHSKLMLFVPSPPRQRKSRGPGNGGAPVALRILAPRYDGTSLGTQNGPKDGHRGQKVVPRELNIVAIRDPSTSKTESWVARMAPQ